MLIGKEFLEPHGECLGKRGKNRRPSSSAQILFRIDPLGNAVRTSNSALFLSAAFEAL